MPRVAKRSELPWVAEAKIKFTPTGLRHSPFDGQKLAGQRCEAFCSTHATLGPHRLWASAAPARDGPSLTRRVTKNTRKNALQRCPQG